MATIEQMQKKQLERIAKFAEFGIKAKTGGFLCLGEIGFSIAEIEKLLRLIKKNKSLEEI